MNDKKETLNPAAKKALQLKIYMQQHGAHKPKNRSSKHLRRINDRNVIRSMSNAVLSNMTALNFIPAVVETNRRSKKRAKRLAKAN